MNIRKEFLILEGNLPRIKGKYVVCLNNGINFLADTVWLLKGHYPNNTHFRFNMAESLGEKRIEADKVKDIIEINYPKKEVIK